MSGKGDRALKTLYVTGFNSKHTSKRLLEELFTQGGPVVDITMFDSYAYVLFQHEESVPYCLALFNETEIHGQKLRLNPRHKTESAYSYLKYLNAVRDKLRSEFMKIPPPDLPPKRSALQANIRKPRNRRLAPLDVLPKEQVPKSKTRKTGWKRTKKSR